MHGLEGVERATVNTNLVNNIKFTDKFVFHYQKHDKINNNEINIIATLSFCPSNFDCDCSNCNLAHDIQIGLHSLKEAGKRSMSNKSHHDKRKVVLEILSDSEDTDGEDNDPGFDGLFEVMVEEKAFEITKSKSDHFELLKTLTNLYESTNPVENETKCETLNCLNTRVFSSDIMKISEMQFSNDYSDDFWVEAAKPFWEPEVYINGELVNTLVDNEHLAVLCR